MSPNYCMCLWWKHAASFWSHSLLKNIGYLLLCTSSIIFYKFFFVSHWEFTCSKWLFIVSNLFSRQYLVDFVSGGNELAHGVSNCSTFNHSRRICCAKEGIAYLVSACSIFWWCYFQFSFFTSLNILTIKGEYDIAA